jgi:hypothetical protein
LDDRFQASESIGRVTFLLNVQSGSSSIFGSVVSGLTSDSGVLDYSAKQLPAAAHVVTSTGRPGQFLGGVRGKKGVEGERLF